MTLPRCLDGLTLLARFRDTTPGSREMRDAWGDWKAHKAGCGLCSGREAVGEMEAAAAGNGRPVVQQWSELE